jgi:hypothetical protein
MNLSKLSFKIEYQYQGIGMGIAGSEKAKY